MEANFELVVAAFYIGLAVFVLAVFAFMVLAILGHGLHLFKGNMKGWPEEEPRKSPSSELD